MTSTAAHAGAIEDAGGRALVCDARDAAAVREAVAQARPEVVVNQLTRLPVDYNLRTIDYGPTNDARAGGGRNLLAAALEAGTRRLVTQSLAFLYAPQGPPVVDEDAPPWEDAPEPFRTGLLPTLEHEREVLGAGGIEALVLRYGFFYGPGTHYAADGSIGRQVRGRRFPIVGRGEGVFSFVHFDDAATATAAAIERGAPGIYNVVDDDPAPLREWLPVYAEAIGAKRPLRAPVWLARLAAGPFAVAMSTQLRGASNRRARSELGWKPSFASWREGFREGLG
jgi:nucleoside-diphosphate-sugar epimerase